MSTTYGHRNQSKRFIFLAALALGLTVQSYALTLEVDAGSQDRIWCPVEIAVPEGTEIIHRGVLSVIDGAHDIVLPGRLRDGKLSFVIPNLPSGEKRVYELTGESPTAVPVNISRELVKNHVKVTIRGEEFTRFHHKPEEFKPYLWPVYGPSTAGQKPVEMTRSYPMAEPQITKDHHHHRSVWSSHGDVSIGDGNRYNTWHESEGNTAWQVVEGVYCESGAAYGLLLADIQWLSPDKKTPILKDQRAYRFYDTPADARMFDMDLTLTAEYADVTFGDTKEGGFFSIRVNDFLNEKHDYENVQKETFGVMTNSEGMKTKAMWGTRAAWVDYSGTLAGVECGMAIFDHPSSFRHKPYWHARDYGLLTANVFGYSHFNKGKEGLPQDGSHKLAKGESLKFRFRCLVHAGDGKAANVARYYEDFVNPPEITWKDQ